MSNTITISQQSLEEYVFNNYTSFLKEDELDEDVLEKLLENKGKDFLLYMLYNHTEEIIKEYMSFGDNPKVIEYIKKLQNIVSRGDILFYYSYVLGASSSYAFLDTIDSRKDVIYKLFPPYLTYAVGSACITVRNYLMNSFESYIRNPIVGKIYTLNIEEAIVTQGTTGVTRVEGPCTEHLQLFYIELKDKDKISLLPYQKNLYGSDKIDLEDLQFHTDNAVKTITHN